MRILSTHTSAAAGEVSVLAILETCIAISVSVWISVIFDSTLHIFVSAILAPFLLLRTEESIDRGLRWYSATFSFFEKHVYNRDEIKVHSHIKDLLDLILIVPFMTISALLIKLFALVVTVWSNPINSIKSIPQNWWNISLATDTASAPELMPGIETTEINMGDADLTFGDLAKNLTSIPNDFDDFLYAIMSIIAIPLLFIPSILYRYSLKATSLIYLPIIWILGSRNQKDKEIIQLDHIRHSQIERIKRIYSWLVLIFFTALPLYVVITSLEFRHEIPYSVLVDYFFPLKTIDSWHMSRALAAIITIAMSFLADSYLIRYKHDNELSLKGPVMALNASAKMRLLLSLWTIGCGFYLLAIQVNFNDIPNVRWFPS